MSDIDPIAAMHRANQAFHGQLVQTAPLDCGVAHFSSEFGAMANQIRDVTLPDGWSMERAFELVQGFFGQFNHPCRIWAPTLEQPAEPLEEFLEARGYAPSRRQVYALRPWPELARGSDVRIVPGRAVRQALAELTMGDPSRGSPEGRQLSTDMMLARLNDPQFDVLVAMAEGRAVGHGYLLQIGPIAAVYNVYVSDEFRRRGIAQAIMHDIINTCRRLELRTVVLEVGQANTDAMALYEKCGFEPVGASVDFRLQGRSS